MSNRIGGTVKWFNNPKGYGFINALKEGEQDIFIHYSSIVAKDGEYRTLKPQESVTFVLGGGSRGPYALQVMADARASELQEDLRKMQEAGVTDEQKGARVRSKEPIDS